MLLLLFLFFWFTRNTVYLAQITGIFKQLFAATGTKAVYSTHITPTKYQVRQKGSVGALYAMKWKNTTFT